MAVYYARSSGNVNGTIWATTPSGTASNLFGSFTNQDVLMSNNFTVTLNVDTTVLEVRTDNFSGATTGGNFLLANGVTLRANVISDSAAGVTYGGSLTATIIGNITAGTGTNFHGVSFTSATGTLNIIGNLRGNIGGSASGLFFNGLGTVNIVGDIFGGSGVGSAGPGVNMQAAGILNITGNVVGGSAFSKTGISVSLTASTINIVGNVSGGIGQSSHGISTNGACTINITGNVNGGTGTTSYGILVNLNSSQTINIIGVATASSLNPAVFCNNGPSCVLTLTRARGNGFGAGSVGFSNVSSVVGSQTIVPRIYELEYGALGNSPTSGPIEIIGDSTNVAIFAVRNSSSRTLVDLNNAPNLIPSSGNVRSGVSYNYGNSVGSCVIPNANSVVYGVRVDNTIGSGLLSPAAVWNYLTTSISTSGSIGERLKNASTVATVGKQLEGAL